MYDNIIFYWLYELWQGNNWLALLIRFLAIYLPWLVALGIFTWPIYKKKWPLLFFLSAVAGFSIFMMEILKWFINRPRPYILFTHINPLFTPGGTLAMPSAHALVFSALATFIFFKNRRIGIILYLATLASSVARVSAGVHWPSDILVGAIIGVGIGYVAHLLEPLVRKKWLVASSQ
jgi:undecaprenyl-diphosphatase